VLPGLWPSLVDAREPRSGGAPAVEGAGGEITSLPLTDALNAARALSALDPWERAGFQLSLERRDIAMVELAAVDEVRQAALMTVVAAQPLLASLLRHSDMLDEAETKRLETLLPTLPTAGEVTLRPPAIRGPRTLLTRISRIFRTGPRGEGGGPLLLEIRKRGVFQRLGWLLAGRRWDAQAVERAKEANAAPLAVVAAGDGSETALYTMLQNERTLHAGLAEATFRNIDRKSTRRRRQVNALKFTGGFIAFQFLDFFLANL